MTRSAQRGDALHAMQALQARCVVYTLFNCASNFAAIENLFLTARSTHCCTSVKARDRIRSA